MYSQSLDKNKPKGRTRFFESYRDKVNGKKRTVSVVMDKNTAATRQAAQEILLEKIRQAAAAAGSPESITLGELIRKYNAYQAASFKPSTCLQNQMHMVKIERALGSGTLVKDLTAGRIVEALNSFKESATWKNEKLRHIKALIRWAYYHEYVENKDFIERIQRWPEPSAREKIQDKFMERDELKALCAGMVEERWALLTRFLALSGLRIGEAIALHISDLDFKQRKIKVTKSYALNIHEVTTTKTGSSTREVYMRRELFDLCRTIRQLALRQANVYGYPPRLLFADLETGGYMKYESYAKYFRENTKKILGRQLGVHSLRHTFTSLMAENNVPLDVISRQLGHHDSQITRDIYFHVTRKLAEQDAEQLEAVAIF